MRGLPLCGDVAVDGVLNRANELHRIGTAVPLSTFNLVAHVGPVEHRVGGLTGPAHCVSSGSRTRHKGLLTVAGGFQILQDIPCLVGRASHP